MSMRTVLAFVLLAFTFGFAQQSPEPSPNLLPELKKRTDLPPGEAPAERPQKSLMIVPAGTKVPIQLRQAISTKNAQPGDAIYGQTTFPIVLNDRVMIPAGTYAQGVVDRVRRAGRIKGTAELAFHLTTLIYPNGYTVNMAAAVDQVPGAESSQMKEPGTIRQDSEKGKDLENIGRGAAQGAAIGSTAGAISGSVRGIGIGGLSGIGAGTMIAMLRRGSDVRFETGTVVDVVLNQAIALDSEKIMRATAMPAYYPRLEPALSDGPMIRRTP
jgi:type IV secretion system protein VirB10